MIFLLQLAEEVFLTTMLDYNIIEYTVWFAGLVKKTHSPKEMVECS